MTEWYLSRWGKYILGRYSMESINIHDLSRQFEEVPVNGIFRLKVYRSGVLIEEQEDSNLIVNGARIQMAHLVAGEVTGRHITKIAFGTSGKEPEPTDTAITNQFVKPISDFSYPESGRVTFDWELLVTENNGMAILEFGLLSHDGTLFARKSRVNPIHKASDISLEGQWTLIF